MELGLLLGVFQALECTVDGCTADIALTDGRVVINIPLQEPEKEEEAKRGSGRSETWQQLLHGGSGTSLWR